MRLQNSEEQSFSPFLLSLSQSLNLGFLELRKTRVSLAGVSASDDEEFPATFNPPSPPSLWDWCTDTESGVACIILYYPQGSWTALTTVWSYRCGSPVRLVIGWVSDLLEGSRSITVTFAKYSEATMIYDLKTQYFVVIIVGLADWPVVRNM